jgi:hypothetical protein
LNNAFDRHIDLDQAGVITGGTALQNHLADAQNFSRPPVRPTRGNATDHIDSHQSDDARDQISVRR